MEPFSELLIPLFESSPIMMGIVWIENGEIIHMRDNPAMEDFIRKRSGKPAKTPPFSNRELGFSAEQNQFWLDRYAEAERLKKPVNFSEKISTPQGDVWFHTTLIYLGEKTGKKFYSFMAEDITEKRTLFDTLRAERERFELAIQGSNAGLWDWDPRTDMTYFSPHWKEMLGYQEHEIENTYPGWESLVHPEDKPHALRLLQEYMEGKVQEYQLEHRLRCKDGSYRWILSKGAALRDKEGKAIRFTGWHIDIHQLRSTIEELKRKEKIIQEQQVKIIGSAKMSSLGEMAGGIAHEINNPLAIIGLSANQISEALDKKPADLKFAKESAENIGKTVRRIGKIVKGLRSFSRSGEKDPFTLSSLQQIIDDTLELCRERFAGNGLRLILECDANLQIPCRSVQISQVLLNLLNNSFDAVMETTDPWVKIETKVIGALAEIKITDSGKGVSPEIAEKLMAPFFTTKEVGAGTGLGLSISKGIIEDHRGTLEYNPDSPHTQFVIHLPIK
jgi:PAS domain S-box-containing protein